MVDHTGIKAIKATDPVWKRLRFDRIWKLLFLAYILIYLIFSAENFWRTEGAFAIFVIFFLSFGIVGGTINQFRWERYWKRIGQRRLEALRDPQPFVVSNQPWPATNALPLPVTIRLRWSRLILVVAVALIIIIFGLILLAILLTSLHRGNILEALAISGVIVLIMLIFALLAYFLSMRYQTQEIELTAGGLRTRYMGHERKLRWDEARIFAMYDAQGIKKSAFARTYELSNEQTVVRWGQPVFANPFLVVQSSVQKREDFHWLVEQINALVAAHSGLSLLDFSDRSTVRGIALQTRGATISAIPAREQPEEVHSLAPVRIAQHDPLLRRMQLRGESGAALALLCALSVVAIVAGLVAKLSNNGGSVSGVFSGGFSSFLLAFGAIMLVVLLFALSYLRLAQGYGKRIGQLRPEALQQPERFRAREQPAPYMELPQPASIRIHSRRIVMMPLTFIENFVLWFLSFALLFGLGGNRLFIALVISLLASLVMIAFLTPFIEKAQERRIEITPGGIISRFGGVNSQVRWQDARLFSSYRGVRLFKRSSRAQVYERASEQTVVRWLWPHSRFQMFTTEPEMSQQAFDTWMEHVNGYVNAQTHLPLVELDTADS
jgi:hypothetical protein